MTLTGKTIFVTGAARGTGAAIARSIAAAGGRVVIGYAVNRPGAEAVAAEIGAGAAGLVQADFADPAAVEPAWREARTFAGGKLDGLVINHGIFEPASVHDSAEVWSANWARTLQVDLQSCADLARLAARDWVDAPEGGALVAIASRAGHRGDDADHPAYAAAKAGLLGLIKTLARAYSGRGLLAYAVAPGWIDTDMAPKDPAMRSRAAAEIPLGRMADPAEIGALCAFLLSGACASATGATFDVNGASHVR